MFNRNEDLKKARGKVPNWAIAEKLGVSENTLYRMLRRDLSEGEKGKILTAIEQAKSELAEVN
jgi:transposase